MRDPSDLPENDRPTGERHAPPGTGMGQPGSASPALAEPASGQPTLTRLKRRADFLHAAKGKRWHGKALSLHAAPARPTRGADPRECVPGGGAPRESAPAVARVGFTLTKKVGNAVVRNRARRRLREAIRLAGDLPAQAGYDYVVIGRIDAVRVPFAALRREIVRAVGDVHGARSGRGTRASGPRPQDLSPQDEPSPRKPNASKPDAAKPNASKPRTIRP